MPARQTRLTSPQPPSTASSSSQNSHQPRFSVLAPESLFGWPALLTAIKSVLASLPFFSLLLSPAHQPSRSIHSTPLSSEPSTMSAPVESSHPHLSTNLQPLPQESSPVDVSMTPLSPTHHLLSMANETPAASSSCHSSTDSTLQSSHNTASHSISFSKHSNPVQQNTKPLALTALPDELIAMCYADLSATDLVALEHVSRRLRHLIAYDSVCWKKCTESRWGYLTSNSVLLPAAARHAGTWKQLYSEKAVCEAQHAPWLTLCKSETVAVFDIIKAHDSAPESRTSWPMSMDEDHSTPASPPKDTPALLASASPVSVMTTSSPLSCLSVVLLIDASSSVTDDDFDSMKTFARALVENLRSTHPESSVAVVQFNQHPKVEVSLTNVCKSKLSTSIENMEQLMGSTDIAAPIRRARQILVEDASPGDRAIVLLTDGQTHADELQESEREARKASEEVGARLYTLGVGRDIDEFGLGRVAAGSHGGMHFTLRRLVSSK